jgi:large subunit ribosomal protein L14
LISTGSYVLVSDNSGAILGFCLNVLKCSINTGALPGQTLVIDIKKNIFKKHITKKSRIITKGQICKALVIRSCRGIKRWGNFFIRSSKNAVVLLNQYNAPYATRLIGFILREVRCTLLFRKIISMAELNF